MLKDLSCPKCGAPITLENERQKLVLCGFCNATSIVDLEDRDHPRLTLEESGAIDSVKPLKAASLWGDAWKRLLKNKLAVFGLVVLAIMVLLVTIGPAIFTGLTGLTADYIPADGNLLKSFPPSWQHPMGTDEAGRDIFARVLQGGRISLAVGIISTFVSLVVGVSYGAVAGYLGGSIDNVMMRIVDIIYAIPYILVVIVLLSVFGGPNTQVLIQWLPSILAGIVVGVAVMLGAFSLYRRFFGEMAARTLGERFLRLVAGVLMASAVFVLIGAAAYLVGETGIGATLGERYKDRVNLGLSQIFLLFFALGLVSWLTMARVVRGQILSLKNQEFVLAAKATGVSTFGIIFRHLVPNALGPVIVYSTLTVPSVMLSEAFLSYLGLGVQAPYASWGSLAADGVKNIAIFPWQLIFPGVTMALTLFSLNFLGDGLRDALDPQTRKF
ncbi:MAG: ABC transporter permease [bacterium]|nr:ABC transporter permease [bacterium]